MSASTRRRSISYPRITISDAIELIKKLFKEYTNSSLDRDGIATALGYTAGTSGSVTMRVAALVHFGLLEKVSPGMYQISDLAQRIVNPLTNAEKVEAITEAVLKPGLFNEIYNSFRTEKVLPEGLHVIMVKQYGIARNSAKRVDYLFRESAKYAKLIDSDSRIMKSGENDLEVNKSDDDMKNGVINDDLENDELKTLKNGWHIQFPMSEGNAVLSMPKNITRRDLEKLRKYLEILELDINE